jgi:comEA protein
MMRHEARTFRSLSGPKDYNQIMLNDPSHIANFERTSSAAQTIAAPQNGPRTISSQDSLGSQSVSRRPLREWPITIGLLAAILFAMGLALRPQVATNRLANLEYPPIVVSVSGEVAHPGTYELPWGARIKDAIKAAGGTTQDAEASLLNPAAQLEDGEQLLVPGKAVLEPALGADTKGSGASGPTAERINLNTASLAQLESLPGVGPKFAARLIAGRPYSGFEDVDRVKGIGPKMLEKLKPLVRF